MKNGAKKKIEINEFFDIHKFPAQPGITVLGISIPLINSKQSPAKCLETTKWLVSKIKLAEVGALVSYSDGLYMNSNEPASRLKRKFQKLIADHKKGYLKLLKSNPNLIHSAFSFITWTQSILDCEIFLESLDKLKKIYAADKRFQKYVELDIKSTGRKITQNNIDYVLEEVLLDYLTVKGKVNFQNNFVKTPKWILNCYHGKPHRSHVHIHQIKFLGLDNKDNLYQNCWYDLENKKLYEFDRLDIESFDFNSSN